MRKAASPAHWEASANGKGRCRCGMRRASPSACRRDATPCSSVSAPREATQLALGFAYAAYRFERYKRVKPERSASLDPPADADLGYVAAAAEALAHGARLDQYAGR